MVKIMKTKPAQKNIPEGWKNTNLGAVSKIYDGTHQTPTYVEQGVPFYSVEHITSNNFTDTKYITEDVYKAESLRVKIEKGDVLMSRIGDIGTARYVDWDARASFYVTLALIKLRSSKEIGAKFLSFAINSEEFRREIWKKTLHVAFPNKINLGDISECEFNLPPLLEQDRIVAVLETWDKAIEKLTKTIEIKKQVKKGLMQELLAGKIRLPAFTEKWVYKRLSELCDIGTGKKNNQDKIESGAYPFFVRSQNIERINSYSYDGEAILVPGEGNVGKIFHYIDGKFDYHQRVYKISEFKDGVLGKFIYFYLLKNFSKATKSDSAKATVDSLRLPTFTNFKVSLPSLEEQRGIVAILDTVDKEIQELEHKLKFLQEQKRYLLNNLITGAIRTSEKLSTHN